MRTRRIRKLVSLVPGLLVLACLWFYFAPVGLGGSTSYVVTDGISMEPRFHAGDLAIVRGQSSYHVGEIVAYHSKMFHTVVLHRIVALAGSRYVFKGDNNNFFDFEHPAASQLIGALWIHIPGAGARLESIRSPALIGVLVALGTLLFAGGAFVRKRRRRRRENRAGETGARSQWRLPRQPAQPHTGALIAGLLTLVPFLALALLAFTRAPSARQPFNVTYSQSGKLSYSARSTPGPTYANDRVLSGEPVFTHVVSSVDLRFAYNFHAATAHSLSGKAQMLATVAGSSGWQTTLDLGPSTHFRGDHVLLHATLDLSSLLALLHQVQTTTGMGGEYTLTLTPKIDVGGSVALLPLRTSFSPKIAFALSQLELQPAAPTPDSGTGAAPAGEASSASSVRQLTQSSSGSVSGKRPQPLYLALGLARLSVANARGIALGGIALVVCALLAALAFVRPRVRDESAEILARYGRAIVPVARVWQLPGVPVIDVADMDALASIAEHYDRSILHERSDAGDAFWVSDESGQFRYALRRSAPETAQTAEWVAPESPSWSSADAPAAAAGAVLEPTAPEPAAAASAYDVEPSTAERLEPDAGDSRARARAAFAGLTGLRWTEG